MDELNNNVLSFFDGIVSRWEKENFASTPDKLVCAFFPYINFLSFTFPIYFSINGTTMFAEWYTLDLLKDEQILLRFWDTYHLEMRGLKAMGETCAVSSWHACLS